MKLKTYIENLNALVKDHPEALEMNVISSKDDEGNGFNDYFFPPELGNYSDGEFLDKDSIDDNKERYPDECQLELNAVCVN